MSINRTVVIVATLTTGLTNKDYVLEVAMKTFSKRPKELHLKISYDKPDFEKRLEDSKLKTAYEECSAKKETAREAALSIISFLYEIANNDKVYLFGYDTNKDLSFLNKLIDSYNDVAVEKMRSIVAKPILDLSQLIIYKSMEGKLNINSFNFLEIENYFDITHDDMSGIAKIYCDSIFKILRRLIPCFSWEPFDSQSKANPKNVYRI